MVVRLVGKINNVNVVLSRDGEGDVWKCTFPFPDGCYEAVAEFTAYDEAGNFSFKTCYLITFDPDSLYINMEPVSYWLGSVLEDDILECVSPCNHSMVAIPDRHCLILTDFREELMLNG